MHMVIYNQKPIAQCHAVKFNMESKLARNGMHTHSHSHTNLLACQLSTSLAHLVVFKILVPV